MSDPQQPVPGPYPPPLGPPYAGDAPPSPYSGPYPPQPYQPWAPVVMPPTMPGTVRALTIITYVTAAITIGMILVFVLFAVLLGSMFFGLFGTQGTGGLAVLVLVTSAGAIGSSLFACWLAWQTGRRKDWARYALTVSSLALVVLSVIAFSPASILTLAGSITVLVLLYVPETNEWFRTAPPKN